MINFELSLLKKINTKILGHWGFLFKLDHSFFFYLLTPHYGYLSPQRGYPDYTSRYLQFFSSYSLHCSCQATPLLDQKWLLLSFPDGADQNVWSVHMQSSCCSLYPIYASTTLTSCFYLSQHSQQS